METDTEKLTYKATRTSWAVTEIRYSSFLASWPLTTTGQDSRFDFNQRPRCGQLLYLTAAEIKFGEQTMTGKLTMEIKALMDIRFQ
jgi:hypothetical protein